MTERAPKDLDLVAPCNATSKMPCRVKSKQPLSFPDVPRLFLTKPAVSRRKLSLNQGLNLKSSSKQASTKPKKDPPVFTAETSPTRFSSGNQRKQTATHSLCRLVPQTRAIFSANEIRKDLLSSFNRHQLRRMLESVNTNRQYGPVEFSLRGHLDRSYHVH